MSMIMNTLPRFSNDGQKDFAFTLRQRVDEYFTSNNISKNANTSMVLRTIFCLTVWVGGYLTLVLGNYNLVTQYGIWAIMGITMVWGAINIGHDAIHGAYSKNKWINALLSRSFDLNGASAYMWTKMHNTAHHTYTNIEGLDEDLKIAPFVRFSPEQPLKPSHKYQYLFTPFMYSLATLAWVFVKDYVKFFQNKVGNYNGQKHPAKEYFYLFFYKAIYYILFIAIPLYFVNFPWYHIMGGFLLMHFIAGFYLGLTFVLAHIVEETHFPIPKTDGTIENSWLVHQLYTTANFAAQSKVVSFLTGGLNCQVEHHLFPNTCSIHYPQLSAIVEKTAHEYDLPYYNNPTFFTAVKSHFKFLYKIGRTENYTPLPHTT